MSAFFSRIAAFFMSVIILLSGGVMGTTEEKAEKLRVVSYLAVVGPQTIENLDTSHFDDVTDIILIGCAGFNKDEEMWLCDGFDEVVEGVKRAAEGKDIRIHLNADCMDGSDNETLHKQALRTHKLQHSIKEVLEKYDFDGIHFDYEFPMSWTSKVVFGWFLASLDEILGDEYMIGSATCPEYAPLPPSGIRALDMVELMCYDNWNEEGFHAPIENMQSDVKKMLSMGYKLSQLNIGLPFYARPTTHETFWYWYCDYYDKLDEKGLYYDPNTDLTFSFNTPELIYEKTQWAIENGAGGMMVFHYMCDVPKDNDASLFNAIIQAKTDLAS